MKEREISLVDLIVEILLRWRLIIIVMLIGGVLMGGLSYVKSYRTAQMQMAQNAEMKEQQMKEEEPWTSQKLWLEEQLTVIQLANVETVLANEGLCKEQEDYYNHSVLMQLDANNLPRAEVTFYVDGEDAATVNNLVQVYGDLVVAGEMLDRLASKLGLSQSAVSELVYVERTSTNNLLGSTNFCVSVMGDTEENCKTAMAEIISYVQEQSAQLTGLMGEHTVAVLKQSCMIASDTDLLERQRTVMSNIVSLKTSIAKAKDAFSDEEKDYYSFLTADSAAVDTEESSEEESEMELIPVITTSVSIKFVILGMILAAFLCVFVIFLRYILNTRIRANDQIASIYNIPLLGQIAKESDKKKVFGFVDRIILSLRNRNKRSFSTEETLELVAVAVKIESAKRKLDEVYCIGCDMQKGAAKVCEYLQKQLEKSPLKLVILDNVLYNAEAMEQLSDAKGIVLVETVGVTLYNEIAEELELVQRQGIPVLGCIIVE